MYPKKKNHTSLVPRPNLVTGLAYLKLGLGTRLVVYVQVSWTTYGVRFSAVLQILFYNIKTQLQVILLEGEYGRILGFYLWHRKRQVSFRSDFQKELTIIYQPFRVNCSFYFKIGACRHGDRCSRLHNKPTFSQVQAGMSRPNLYCLDLQAVYFLRKSRLAKLNELTIIDRYNCQHVNLFGF